MAFDLYITFAGLCLFRRPKKEEKKWIEVLLPPTEGHAHCHEDVTSSAATAAVPGHFARLGYHVRYDPTLTGSPGKRFKELEFKGKNLDLSFLDGNPLNREFRHMDVVDITDVVETRLDPGRAIGRVKIGAGSLCPGSVCEHFRGARWHIPGKKPTQHMSTLVTWRIRGLKEVVQGGEGLELTVTNLDPNNPGKERHGILRPVGGQIRIYLFHTPYDELPSQGVPHFRTWTSGGMKGKTIIEPTEADHFMAYYALFPGHMGEDVPKFVDEGEEDEDERDSPEAALDLAATPARFHHGLGRRYNCILTVVDDEGQG